MKKIIMSVLLLLCPFSQASDIHFGDNAPSPEVDAPAYTAHTNRPRPPRRRSEAFSRQNSFDLVCHVINFANDMSRQYITGQDCLIKVYTTKCTHTFSEHAGKIAFLGLIAATARLNKKKNGETDAFIWTSLLVSSFGTIRKTYLFAHQYAVPFLQTIGTPFYTFIKKCFNRTNPTTQQAAD